MADISPFDLPSQISYYAAYHDNKINKAIHFIGVPLLLWSALVLLALIPFQVELPVKLDFLPYSEYLVANAAFFVAVVYSLYYIVLEPVAGSLATVCITSALISANAYAFNNERAWEIAALIQVVAWVSQFIGHGVFEGRRPTLIDNLIQALLLAPFFVFFELLFFFGYRPALQRQVHKFVADRLKKINSASSSSSSSSAAAAKRRSKSSQ
eukprot:TRINITY_DN5699_c0_g1_i1.p1 TRINITY_DN5699_c0_g1~~TRINITY_DN5699_c0_g1_i1.p1  ORF type:complete len:211 (-),score=46.52 TRINITY_DN5699_c0_g1_i1:107-739(-)